jgi:PAS domain S-box-containing protein
MTNEDLTGTNQPESLIWAWALVESAVDGIISIDGAGIIEYANHSALKMFGYTQEEILGRNVKMLMPQPFQDRHDEYLKHYMQTGEKKIIGIGRDVVGMRKDHSTFPIHLSVSEVELEGKRRFTGSIHDISEQKEAQVEKDHLLQQLNWRNKELNCLYRIGELVRGGELNEKIQHEIVQILDGALSDSEVTGLRLSMEDVFTTSTHFQETPWELSVEILVEDRRRGLLEIFFVHEQVKDSADSTLNEKQSLLNAIARLLGESLGHREAEVKVVHASKLASIGELAAGVGHEINNPVNSIINCADILLKQAEPDTKLAQFSEHIRSEADRIATIVRDLLTFSRQDTTLFSVASMRDIVETVLTLCGKNIERSRIHLELDIPDDLPKLECRSEQVQQVLMNLVINAIHALNEKYPQQDENKKITISAIDQSDNAVPNIRLSVRDNGTGISPTHLERIYDPFFTTKGRDSGTGLGLSVSDGIIKNHNGNMSVDTQWGEYTNFYVDLPLSIQRN